MKQNYSNTQFGNFNPENRKTNIEFKKESIVNRRLLTYIVASGAFFLTGCSSLQKSPSAKIEKIENSYALSEELTQKAQKTLKDFSSNLSSLENKANKSENLVQRQNIVRTLQDLNNRVEEARIQFREIELSNSQAETNFERQIQQTATDLEEAAREVEPADRRRHRSEPSTQ